MSPIAVFLDWFSNFYLFDWLGLAVFLIGVIGYRFFLSLMLRRRPDNLFLGKLQQYRKAWIESHSGAKDSVVVVQTLRNTIMIPSFLPYTTMGLGVIVNPTPWLSIMSAVADTDGRAKTGLGAMNLVYTKLDLAGIVHTMRYGRPGTMMSAKRHQLTNPQINDIAHYVYALRYDASPVRGSKLYEKFCVRCHATPADIRLMGNEAGSERRISDLSDQLLYLRIKRGRHLDRAGKGVAHLNDDQIQDIISYIRQAMR